MSSKPCQISIDIQKKVIMINISNIQRNKTQRNCHDQLHVISSIENVKCLPLFVLGGDKDHLRAIQNK